jgi:hypothetical protein
VYTSDQGHFLGEHGLYDKRWMYETSFRTPLLMRLPGAIAPGHTSDELVMNLDFASTILDVVGLAGATPPDIQGESFKSLLGGTGAGSVAATTTPTATASSSASPSPWAREAVYYHFYENPGWCGVKRHYGARTGQHKIIHYYSADIDSWELVFLAELVRTVLILCTEIVPTVLMSLTEAVRTVLIFRAEIVLTVWVSRTETVLTVLIIRTEIVLAVLVRFGRGPLGAPQPLRPAGDGGCPSIHARRLGWAAREVR